MQQPWPFRMSPARPPGCDPAKFSDQPLLAFPGTTAALRSPFLHHCRRERESSISFEQSPQHHCTTSAPSSPELGQVPPVRQIVPSELGRIFLEKSPRWDGELCLCQDQGIFESRGCHENTAFDSRINEQFRKPEIVNRYGNWARDNAERGNVPLTDIGGRIQVTEELGNENCSHLQETSSSQRLNWTRLDMEGVLLALDEKEVNLYAVDILCLMQKCKESKNSLFSFRLHQHFCENGLETDVIVGNHLVPMFVECGDLRTACQIFNKLVYQNEHSWSFLVLGYCRNKNLQHALDLYRDMNKSGIQPTRFTFLGLLKACGLTEDLQVGRNLHEQIKQKSFGGDVLVGNSLVDMYIKCGSLGEAEEVFEELPVRDVFSWTALLTGFVECDLGKEALVLYHKMQSEGISANSVTLSLAAKACRIMQDLDEGRMIHSKVLEKGYDNDITVSNSMLSLYSKCGCLNEACEVFDKLIMRDVVSWNVLIAAYIEHSDFQEPLDCFEQMQVEKVVLDAATLSYALKACANLEEVEQGQEIHIRSVELGLAENLSVANSLIGFYGRCGLLSEARNVFDKLKLPDVVSWTALIAGYAEHSLGKEALSLFKSMENCGFAPNGVTYSCVLKACGSVGFHVDGREFHTEVVRKGLDLEADVANTLVSMYVACGLLEEASDVFERFPTKCVVSWTALIGGYADCVSDVKALKYFDQMQAAGVFPNAFTYACTLKACGSIGAVDKGRELHVLIAWDGFEQDSSVSSALINMYARCGSLMEACEVFDEVSVCDVSVWSAMMKSFAMNHEGSNAIQCFKDMQQQGCKPDAVTFTCLLTACGHAGLAHEGLEYFKLMREDYGVTPTREHYSCMVDLLARSGDLFEAEKFLETFALASEDTWAALLSACKTHGEVDLGFRCFQQLVQKDPENAAWYVLMTDICTGTGRCEDALQIEGLRKHVEAKKKPASAWIEINKEVHEFVVGGDQNDDVLAIVRNLNLRLKDEGHMPNLSGDVRPTSDHQKEVALCEHAEKLAIAFGLLKTPHGTTLRVSKNLRTCTDCHSASKVISKIERREIILRDDCCMHHFKEGTCVCGDMF
ncbi:hypothetical protein L7F22_018514 [Adiantum nelumboides]|nr:hypothetical protein [Adiantum nelumboides]